MAVKNDLPTRVLAAVDESELLQAVAKVNRDGGVEFALDTSQLRSLSDDEVAQLERQGNWADDWSRIRVAEQFDAGRVRDSSFHGDVVLGQFSKSIVVADAAELPSGVYRCTVVASVIGNDALLRDVRLLSNYVVGSEALLLNCGSVVCDSKASFGNGSEISVAVETGGREVAVFAEIDVEIAAEVARSRSNSTLLEAYAAAVSQYAAKATSQHGIIATGATIRDTAQVHNSFVGPSANINGATRVADSTLLSNADERVEVATGACVTGSLLQWGSEVTTMAIVDHSVLTEHSHVERHGKVTDCILGPNTGVAEGEATACLLGPFVGFHHQSLLIAVLWPEGKGNIGYGANVGSNHTSKAPDQEFWPGEGAFLGLGVNIKFPADFSSAPYSIIASGVNTLPQKMSFPFSLVNSPAAQLPGISPAYNEIMPAWLLSNNMFTLKRNEGKYRARNKAIRTKFNFNVFRPDTVDLMSDACRRLEAIAEPKDVYTDRDIKGLGKNYMLETSRQPAIDAYRFYRKIYALQGLKDQVQQLVQEGQHPAIENLVTSASDSPIWEHQRKILANDPSFNIVVGLRQLQTMLRNVAEDVQKSKAKDDQRGKRIIDDYEYVHTAAEEDKFVKQTWDETRQQVNHLDNLISELKS